MSVDVNLVGAQKTGTTFTATVSARFCAAHRLQHVSAGVCQNIHGHNYDVICTVTAPFDPRGTETGMVINFKYVRASMGGWLDHFFDHAFLYQEGDTVAEAVVEAFRQANGGPPPKTYAFSFAPTAENIAGFLLEKLNDNFRSDHPNIRVSEIQVIENRNCRATCRST